MAPWEPATWAWWTWVLHGIGTYYFVGFWIHFVRFHRLENAARAEGASGEAIRAYNASLRGFPAAPYAKMLAKRPIEVGPDSIE